MELKKCLPESGLRDMIRFYWFMEGSNEHQEFSRILPFGALDIIIHRGVPMSLSEDFRISIEPRAFVEGQYKTHQLKKPAWKTSLVGISIYPWASEALFGVPSLDLTGEIVNLNTMGKPEFVELEQMVTETEDKKVLIEKMNVFFLNMLKGCDRNVHADLRLFSSRLVTDNYASIQEVTDKYWGSSLRLLQIRFKEAFGLTISEFRRKQRLQRAIECIHKKQESLTEVALELGFFDQAHFTKTFKSFAGVSPRKYMCEVTRNGSNLPMQHLFS